MEKEIINDIAYINESKLPPITQLINEIQNKQFTLIVKSQMGTGKSTQFINYINQLDKNNKILLLANRRSILLNLSGRSLSGRSNNNQDNISISKKNEIQLNQINTIQLYEKKSPEELININKLCITIESLHKLAATEHGLIHYTLLIIDELPATLDQILSSTVNLPRYTFAVLQHLIKTSDAVMVFSSDDRNVDIQFIKKLRSYNLNSPIYHVINEYKEGGHIMNVFNNYNDFKLLIINKVKEENVKIYIGTDTKSFAKKIYQEINEINNKKIRLYSSENAALVEIKNELLNPNQYWIKYDIIIATPTITHGIDFNINDHFDCQFYYGSCKSIVPRNMIQAMKRVRSFKDKITHLYICNSELNNYNNKHCYLLDSQINYIISEPNNKCIPDTLDPFTSLILAHKEELNDRKNCLQILKDIWVNQLGNI